ncbi:hypothetical protein BH23VER1_BH23VER1_05640 [soil metagenome]
MENFKAEVRDRWGGYTHFDHRNEGVWEFGGVAFRDKVTVLRVLIDEARTGGLDVVRHEVDALRRRLEAALDQDDVLIVLRQVEVVKIEIP